MAEKIGRRDPFWLGIAGIFVIISIFLLIEHSRVAIALTALIIVALLLYYYSDRLTKKREVKK